MFVKFFFNFQIEEMRKLGNPKADEKEKELKAYIKKTNENIVFNYIKIYIKENLRKT